jgi:hypothetical protein
MYSENISGAYRLPNGNTMICSGTIGRFLEVTSANEIVWEYICPVQQNGPITQGTAPDKDAARADETMNSVFRVYKYPLDYAAFTGKILTPGNFIEIYPTTSVNNQIQESSSIRVFPNPFINRISMKNPSGKEEFELLNIAGQTVWKGKLIEEQDFSALQSGIYLLSVINGDTKQTIKLMRR